MRLEDFLCEDIEEGNGRKESMRWIKQNPSQSDIILVGYDQLTYKTEDVSAIRKPVDDKKNYPTSKLLALTINGDILQRTRVHVLSRPRALRQLPASVRWNSIVQMSDFSSSKVKTLMKNCNGSMK